MALVVRHGQQRYHGVPILHRGIEQWSIQAVFYEARDLEDLWSLYFTLPNSLRSGLSSIALTKLRSCSS